MSNLICKYNVTSTTSVTWLCFKTSGFTDILLDGTSIGLVTGYTFQTTGEYTLEFVLKDKTSIGDRAFYYCTGLTGELVIPDSVTTIGDYAFGGCKGLTSVEIGSGVTTIGREAFVWCNGLTGELVIPDSVTEIGYYAFRNCDGLTSVVIGSGVTTIGALAFDSCTGLESIVVEGNTAYDSRENCNCIIETSTNTLIQGCKNSFIPNSVTSIDEWAFSECYGLTGELVIPDSVTTIYQYAFWGCSGLTSVVIPDSVTYIGSDAFAYCYGLTGELVIPDSVTTIDDSAFIGCSGLTSVVIGSGVTYIGDSAFEYCKRLTSVVIGSGCTSIDYNAFSECSLSSITSYAMVAPTIEYNTFDRAGYGGKLYYPIDSDYSTWLSTDKYYLGYYAWIGFEIGGEPAKVICTYYIPTTRDDYNICCNTTGFTDILLNGVSIGLDKVHYFPSIGEYTLEFVLKTKTIIGDSAFACCDILTSVVIPNSVKTIGNGAFADCDGLTSIVIPDSVTTIDDSSFSCCSGLAGELVIPDSVTTIGDSAFGGCINLTSVEIGSGVTSIGNGAFENCTGLTGELVIPDSVKTIGDDKSIDNSEDGAFQGCSGLTSVVIGSGVTKIDNRAFQFCSGLTSVVIPDSVTYIGDRAFFCCSGLTSVVIGSGVKAMGYDAFGRCDSLTSVVIGSEVNTIGAGAFHWCDGLTSVVIPDSVTEIGKGAFGGCSGLESVVIGSGVKAIREEAFYQCIKLKKITSYAEYAPNISSRVFQYVHQHGTLIYPEGSDYSSWLSTDEYYLGYYGWNQPKIVLFTSEVNIGYKGGVYTLRVGFKHVPNDGYYIFPNSFTEVGEPTIVSGATEEYDYVLDYLLTIDENTSTEQRGGWVTFNLNNGQSLADFHIIQEGKPDEPTEPDNPDTGTTTNPTIHSFENPIVLDYDIESYSIIVGYKDIMTINLPIVEYSWLVVGNPTIPQGSYLQYDTVYQFPLILSINTSTTQRTNKITFTGYDKDGYLISETVQITQKSNNGGGDEPTEPDNPVNPDEPTGEPDIVIENIPMQYSSYGGAQNVIVRYNNISTVNEPVITSTRASGTVTITPIETLMIDEDYQRYRYTFNVDENEAEEGRTFQVTFSGDAKTKSMSLGQNANTNTATYIELNKIRMDFPSSGSSITVQANYWNTATVLEPTLSESYGTIEKINSNMAPNPKAVLYRVTLPSTSFERRLYMTFQCEDANGNTVQETLNIYQAKPEGYNEPDTEVNDNYIGYFNSLEGKPYEVRLISNPNSNEYKEILLSGENPFVVSYEGSDNIFEPIRKSTATVTVVHNTYLENLLSPYAQGTIVELYSDNKLEWSGYLTPKVYSQNWVEEYETFELEASDCIASLQYLDYQALNGKGLVTFKDIFDDIIKRSNIKGYYWPQSKICNGSYLTPSQIGVFEKNFFSNDTDEPWNLYDVLFEICQFLGLTCVQHKDALYFIDYNDSLRGDSRYDYFSTSTPIRDEFRIKDFNEVDENTFRGNDGTISFVPIYNKVIVKDNMYVCEDIIPNIFDDEKLTNIKGSFYDTYEVEPVTPYKAEYPNGSGWGKQKYKDEEVGDDIYRYFLRIYNHKDYETVYSGTTTLWGGDPVWLLQHIPHGRIVDLGVVKKDYYENHQKVIPNSVDYKRYLCIPMKHTNEVQNTGKTVFRLREGYKIPCMVSKDAFLVLKCSATFERYKWRPYINPDWKSERNKLHLPYNSETHDKIAWPMFRLRIGDKCWSGFRNRWVDLDDSHNYFETEMEWKQDKLDYWNTEIECLNQVSWEENVNESGYKIPLDGVDLNAELQFEVLCPQPSCWGRSLRNGYEYFMMEYNAYCWISDLSIKIMERGQDVDRLDNDIVYENVIDKGSISELNDMEFKLTTYSEMTKPSFSNVIMVGDTNTFLTEIQDRGLGSTGQNAEENCVERYVKQYSTPTKELNMTIANTNHNMIIPFNVMGTNYIPVSASIDYLYDRQTITMTEIK